MSAALRTLPDFSPDLSAHANANDRAELPLGPVLPGLATTPARPTFGTSRAHPSSAAAAGSELPSTPKHKAGNTSISSITGLKSAFGARKRGTLTLAGGGGDDEDRGGDKDGDVLDTPGPIRARSDYMGAVGVLGTPGENSRYSGLNGSTPGGPGDPKSATKDKKSGTGRGVSLTLRDQEKHIDNLKKENFNIKLRVHFLEERLAQLAPDELESVIKQNINLKIEVQEYRVEFKKQKKLMLELERELAKLQQQQQQGGSKEKERELEEALEERDREMRELRKKLSSRSHQVDPDASMDSEAYQELEARNIELEDELENAKNLLQENMDEMEKLKDIVERRSVADDSYASSVSSAGKDTRQLRRQLEGLEHENEELRVQLDQHEEILAQRDDEAEDLLNENEGLRLHIEDLQRHREIENIERSESRAIVLEEREGREVLEDELNATRDRLAAAQIELHQTTEELLAKEEEIRQLMEEHRRVVDIVDSEWREEVDDTKKMVEDLRDALMERDAESKELRLNVAELEANTEDLHNNFEAALARLEEDSANKEAEIEHLNGRVQQMEDQLYVLEDENDRIKEDWDRTREEEGVERERLEGLTAALKEKYASAKTQLDQITELYDQCIEQVHQHRARQEDLARHVEELVQSLESERTHSSQLEAALDSTKKSHGAALSRQQRLTEDKEHALQIALRDLNNAQSMVNQREQDLAQLKAALESTEMESKRLGEQAGTAKLSLQLEIDRLKRDLERIEDELRRARKELEDREDRNRERDALVDKLHAENRDLSTQLAMQTQARLNISEKLDVALASAKLTEGEAGALKSRVTELEGRLVKDQRSLLNAENLYRDQLTERNTLLLTIYQYMDKILGVDKTPKKSGQAETKPFTNFTVFHDNLITRLKQLSQIQLDFDKRCKDVEARYVEKMNEIKKQIDGRWKQIDKFEASVKTYADLKMQWKRRLMTKDGELDALRATNNELSSQISSLRRPGQSDTMEVRSLSARAVNAERRLQNAQNQLLASENKIEVLTKKNVDVDNKWEVRVKEYENMLKRAEERYKKERQGGKEAVKEMENTIKNLERQLELARKRNDKLADMTDQNKVSPKNNSPIP